MNKFEMGPSPKTPSQKQELQSIYDRGMQKIKDYIANFEDTEVKNTAAHFEHLFDDVKKVTDQVEGELTDAQKQELQSIYDRDMQKIKDYIVNFEDTEVKNTAAHFEHLFDDVKKVIESK